MTEQELVKKLQQADQLAFKHLVDKYQDKVQNTCWGFVKSSTEAEDLTQEVFIEIYESIHTFKFESKLGTYIYRVAVNKSLDYIRKQKSQKRWGVILSILSWSENKELPSMPDWEHPGVTLENKERASILMSKVEELPDNQRVAFTLHKIEGLSYQEIAEVMQVSLASVESLIFRAKQNLKKKLQGYYQQGI
ncbi:RNA polymerase sigma factor [Cellulophaga sp. BC115SP]|uniref:RNA polymerase sigma factor n=1 Tax=Cellulophaga sp. BC115SP TaxID=2683263 RepID=UPI0014127EB1|nr:RNA polymerase sigma factor [Cellulophaga sp. BC115SP]NBB27165.1 sigma-70 family RNA polymerase sigma factor [Cellulophaga sp. BC115SP]